MADQYRKLRNTFRYLLGALEGYDGSEGIDPIEMPELERYMLTLLTELDAKLVRAIEDYDFNTYVRALIDFCNEDLSAFYFDIRKDCLYCDAPGSLKRRSCRSVLDVLFQALVRYSAPVLVFTAEEVWSTRNPEDGEQGGSVHLLTWPNIFLREDARADIEKWRGLRALRDTVNEAIEPLRRDKIVRSSLEAEVTVPADAVPFGFSDADLAELFITATVARGQGADVQVNKTNHGKCGRCWRLLPEVAEDGALCARCESTVAAMDAAA